MINRITSFVRSIFSFNTTSEQVCLIISFFTLSIIVVLSVLTGSVTVYNYFARKTNKELDEKLKKRELENYLIEVRQRANESNFKNDFSKLKSELIAMLAWLIIFVIINFLLYIFTTVLPIKTVADMLVFILFVYVSVSFCVCANR